MAMRRDYDYLFKIVLIGDSGVGKSCLLLRFADDSFNDSYISTIGVDFRFRNVLVDTKTIKLQIWDTAGQERFRTITSAYYRGAAAVILIYDVTNYASFEHIEEWLLEVNRHAHKSTLKMLVGNKADLYDDKKVSTDEGQNFADVNAMPFIEVSAKSDTNVTDAFLNMSRHLIRWKEQRLGPILHTLRLFDAHYTEYTLNNSITESQVFLLKKKLAINGKISILMKIKRNKLCLKLNLNDCKFITDEDKYADNICSVIQILENYTNKWDIINYGIKKIFDQMIQSSRNVKECKILCPQKMESKTLEMDYRLYHVMAANVSKLSFNITDALFHAFSRDIGGVFRSFINALQNNVNLQQICMKTYNEMLNNSLYIKTLVDLFQAMVKCNKAQINCFELSFIDNIVFNQQVKSVKDLLHSSIIKCIKSKANSIEIIKIIYKNNARSKIQIFDNKFCGQLLDSNYNKLRILCLDLQYANWNHINLLSLIELMNKNNKLEQVIISGCLFSNKLFDIKKNTQIIQSLTNCLLNQESLNKIELSRFSSRSMEYCIPSFIKILQTLNINILLSFESLTSKQLYNILDEWLIHLQILYKYYKNIKQFFDNKNNLSQFDSTIKTIIFEYCQLEYSLYLSSNALLNKRFIVSQYIYKTLKPLVITHITPQDEDLDVMETLNEMLAVINSKNTPNIYIEQQPAIVENDEDYNELKWKHLLKIDFSLLCFGYIRNIIYIPQPLCYLICNYYPKFDIWGIDADIGDNDDNDDSKPSIKVEKWKISSICDNSNIYIIDGNIYFKPMDHRNKWYEIGGDTCKEFNMNNELALDDEDKKWLKTLHNDNEWFIERTAGEDGFGRNLGLIICTNFGDVLCEAGKFQSSMFLLNSKQYMVDIKASTDGNFVLFLTSNGNIFSFGDNEKGQCGTINSSDDDDIPIPLHLKQLSKHFITKIFVGGAFSLCMDKNGNLYCFGDNENNKLGLNEKNNNKEIIWKPIMHSFFNEYTGNIPKCIDCTEHLFAVLCIDYQCYWNAEIENNDKCMSDIFHWQSSKPEYNDIKIKHVLCVPDSERDDYRILLINIQDEVKVVGDVEEFPFVKFDGLNENDTIVSIAFDPNEGDPYIITSPF